MVSVSVHTPPPTPHSLLPLRPLFVVQTGKDLPLMTIPDYATVRYHEHPHLTIGVLNMVRHAHVG
jgi:hypothetical protein